jgi:hypothetical protein
MNEVKDRIVVAVEKISTLMGLEMKPTDSPPITVEEATEEISAIETKLAEVEKIEDDPELLYHEAKRLFDRIIVLSDRIV